jgi:IS5 family transposase
MKQQTFAVAVGTFRLCQRCIRKQEFREQMDKVVPWAVLVALIHPRSPVKSTGLPPLALDLTLRIHYLQRCFGLSDPAM